MKYRFLLFMILFVGLFSCSKDDFSYNNPNLLNVNVFLNVNLSLPQYAPLQFPMNPIYINGYGNGGIIITNTGGGGFTAYDAADPNHPAESCSVLLIDGIEGVCQCPDHNTYNLVSGTVIESKSAGNSYDYTMKPYRVLVNGDGTITIRSS